MKSYFDKHRHLVCLPYSIANLHAAAAALGIKRCWFHKDHCSASQCRTHTWPVSRPSSQFLKTNSAPKLSIFT